MSRRARRNHTPAFKAKVALAAVKGDRLIANRFVEEFDGLQGNKVYRLSNTPVITIPNATIPLAAPRCRAYLLDQTASALVNEYGASNSELVFFTKNFLLIYCMSAFIDLRGNPTLL